MVSVSEMFVSNKPVMMKLFFYSLLMLSLPIATYFFLLHIVWKGDPNMTGWSGVGAVCMCNFVIAAYAIMAWGEQDDSDTEYVYIREDGEDDDDIPTLNDK